MLLTNTRFLCSLQPQKHTVFFSPWLNQQIICKVRCVQPILPTNGALEEHVSRAVLPGGHARGQVLVSIPSCYLCRVNRAGRRHQRDAMNLLDMPPRYRQAASYRTAVRWGFFAVQVQKKKSCLRTPSHLLLWRQEWMNFLLIAPLRSGHSIAPRFSRCAGTKATRW